MMNEREATRLYMAIRNIDKIEIEISVEGINWALNSLYPNERKVILGRFSDEKLTYRELADILDATIEMVRQIQVKALRKLRHPIRLRRMTLDGWERYPEVNLETENIEELEFGVKTCIKLKRAGIKTKRDLKNLSDERLASIENLTDICCQQIREVRDALI